MHSNITKDGAIQVVYNPFKFSSLVYIKHTPHSSIAKLTMAPNAANSLNGHVDRELLQRQTRTSMLANPFYSPAGEDDKDESYKYAKYKVCNPKFYMVIMGESRIQPSFPKVDWEPLKQQPVTDRGLFADPEKKSLLSSATKVKQLTPAIGCEISGVDLRQLSNTQKDELFVLSLALFLNLLRSRRVQRVACCGTRCRLYVIALSCLIGIRLFRQFSDTKISISTNSWNWRGILALCINILLLPFRVNLASKKSMVCLH